MQSVGSAVERLAFDGDRIAEGDRRVLVGAGAPDLAVGNEGSPDLAIIRQRPVISDGDVRDPDALRDLCALARKRQIENERTGRS